MNSIKYYSFKLGEPRTPMSSWRLLDIKIPAQDPRMAICMHYIAVHYMMTHRHPGVINKHVHMEPENSLVFFSYRQVIEWERISKPKLGQFMMQFKKTKTYSQHEIAQWFQNNPKTHKFYGQ